MPADMCFKSLHLKFRNGHRLMAIFCLLAMATILPAESQAVSKRYSYEEENNTLLHEMRDSVDDMRHEVNNHESEIRMFEEKLNSQESIIDGLRQQIAEANQANKEFTKGSSTNLETKIAGLETTTKGLVADLKQLKTHANDTADVLAQYKKKLSDLEKILESQNQNLDNMQAALKSIMDAMQVKAGVDIGGASSGNKIYRVRPGDSLEKIARINQTTIQALKELNGLSNDRIIVGQTLKVP